MKIPSIHLTGQVQQSVIENNNPFVNNSNSDDALSDIPNFIDWLTEMAPISKTGSAKSVQPLIEQSQAKATTISESMLYRTEAAHETKLSADEAQSDDQDDISPKDVVHLLHEALEINDIQFLKQWVIPNVPIIMGNIPIQQLFPVDESGEISYRGFEVSDNLKALVEKGVKTGRPVRIELDANASVVLKFRNGRVSAEFLSNDQVASWAVKQQLETLKQQLLSKNLPVDDLSYRHSGQKARQQERDGDNAEIDEAETMHFE